MSEPLKILLVEDDKVDALHTRKLLEQGFGTTVSLDWEPDWDSGSHAVDRNAHCLYLIDYRLGPRDGLDLVRHAVEQGCSAPIILLTGMDSDEIDIQAMEAGATDYLCKENLSAMLLKKSIRYALARQQFRNSLIDARDLLAQKNQKLSELYETAHQFVDNVSHEFRTPLTVIKEYAAILQEGLVGGINAEQKDFLDIILSRVDDLGLMVNDMLDTSRLEAGLLGMKREEHHIAEIVDHIRPVLLRRAMGNGVSLSINFDPDLPKAY